MCDLSAHEGAECIEKLREFVLVVRENSGFGRDRGACGLQNRLNPISPVFSRVRDSRAESVASACLRVEPPEGLHSLNFERELARFRPVSSDRRVPLLHLLGGEGGSVVGSEGLFQG